MALPFVLGCYKFNTVLE